MDYASSLVIGAQQPLADVRDLRLRPDRARALDRCASRAVLALHPVERWIQRPVLDLQDICRRALDVARDFVTMGWTEEQRPENQHVERALQQLGA